MTHHIDKLRTKRRLQTLRGGCFFMLLTPAPFLVVGLFFGIIYQSITIEQGLAVALAIVACIPLALGVGGVGKDHFKDAATTQQEMKSFHQKQDAQAGSISLSDATLAGELTEVQDAEGGLEVAVEVDKRR